MRTESPARSAAELTAHRPGTRDRSGPICGGFRRPWRLGTLSEGWKLNRFTLFIAFAVVAVFLLAILWSLMGRESEAPSYPYSQLLRDAAAGRVEAVTQEGVRLEVTLAGETEPRLVNIASESINVYAELCAAAGAAPGECQIEYAVTEPTAAGSVLTLLITSLLPVLLIGSFIYFMMRQAQRTRSGRG